MWMISIDAIKPDDLDPKQRQVTVTYTNQDTGKTYTDNYRLAPKIEELNQIISQNLAAHQNEDCFANLQTGDYTLPVQAEVTTTLRAVADQTPLPVTPLVP